MSFAYTQELLAPLGLISPEKPPGTFTGRGNCHRLYLMAKSDPRSSNTWFESASIGGYLDGYSLGIAQALSKVDRAALERAVTHIMKAMTSNGHVYVAGNGGSAAIADHLCCDFSKGTFLAGRPVIRATSLVANTSVLTALANDFGYEESLAFQVTTHVKPNDLLILISSSGNSENILRALRQAKKGGTPVIGLSGFSGGALAKEADVSLHVPYNNYGIVEDVHQMLMHVMAQYIFKKREAEGK